jgi:hypothetical protein
MSGTGPVAVWAPAARGVAAAPVSAAGGAAASAASPAAYVARGGAAAAREPAVWRAAAWPLLQSALLSLASLGLLAGLALVPTQGALVRAGLSDAVAWVIAVLLLLVEASMASVGWFLLAFRRVPAAVFNAVYASAASPDARHNLAAGKIQERWWCCCYSCPSCADLLWLPIMMIPVVGGLLYAWAHGREYAAEIMVDYFRAHGITDHAQVRAACELEPFYHDYGSRALVLQSLPLLGTWFSIQCAAGLALFAAEREPALTLLGAKRSV